MMKTTHAVFDGLNPAQRDAVLETSQPVLVLAGPGTGKTTMLVAKYVHLVLKQNIKPDRILITTFTTKATGELQERISSALAEAHHYSKIEVQNFHAYCLRLLQEFGSEIGLSREPPVLDGIALVRFLHENRDRFDWKHVPYIRWPQGPLEKLAIFTGRCLGEGFEPKEAMRRAQAYVDQADPDEKDKAREYIDYASNYERVLELLQSKGVLTYDLMLYHAVRLLEARPDLLKQVRGRFDYLLVDEAQDNNGLQTRLIELITAGRPNVTIVGDEDQGIYKFRGARRDNLQHIAATFKPRIINLWENYRSTDHIVRAATAFIGQNPDRFKDKRLEARGKNKDRPAKVDVRAYPNEEQEAIRIAEGVHAELKTGRSPRQVAVIFRSLNSADRLLDELGARGIRYEVTNRGELLRLREVRDLWAWMSVLNDPYTDNPSFARVLGSREVGIDLLDLGRIRQRLQRNLEDKARAEGKDPEVVRVNLVDVLRDLEGAHIEDASRQRLRWARRALEALDEKCRGLGALDTAYEVLGWLRPQLRHPPSDARSQQVWMNLGRFLQIAKTYEQNYPDAKGLRGFLSYLDYLDRQGAEFEEANIDESEDSVKILTAHGSKGLEFPVVFIASACKQRFPAGYRGDWMHAILDPAQTMNPGELHLHEERRVFYVAVTRAQERLAISHPMSIGGKERARSEFIDNLEDLAAEHIDAQVITEELPASETAGDMVERTWAEELHGALAVHGKVDAAEVKDRLRRILEATLHAWKGRVPDTVYAEAEALTAPLGAKVEVAAAKTDALPKLVLSASALNMYDDCPRKFQFQNVLRIPQRISPTAVAGSNVHRALEVFHRDLGTNWRTATEDQLLEVYEKVAATARYSTAKEAEQFRERDHRILREYLRTERTNAGEPTHFEARIDVDMPELGVSFIGYIDRVDEHKDGTVEIVDYKTGSRTTPNKIVAEDFQIALYVKAFEGKGRKVKAGTLYWMRDAGDGNGPIIRDRILRVPTGRPKGEFTDEAMAAFQERLSRTVQDIRAGRFPEKVDDFGCKFCDYRILCPAWGG
ncbi:MAG: ATP-dependent DNA helicase [Candidatus Thermoplasmatota archaeon]